MTEVSESDVSPQITQTLKASGVQLYRNNIGKAKFGSRWVAYGVGGVGGSDHIGYLPVRITPAMVGHIIAVFVGAEAKRPIGGEYTDKQKDFLRSIKSAGGIAGFARSWQEARALVLDWFNRFESPKKPPNVARKGKPTRKR